MITHIICIVVLEEDVDKMFKEEIRQRICNVSLSPELLFASSTATCQNENSYLDYQLKTSTPLAQNAMEMSDVECKHCGHEPVLYI